MRKLQLTVKSLVIVIVAMLFQFNMISAQVATLQNWTNIYHGTISTTQNIPYSVAAGSNANRILVVAVASSRSQAGSVSVTLTYGGQAMLLADGDMGRTNARQHTALYYLDEAGMDAAADNILAITVSGGTTGNTDVWAALFDYINQTTPLTNTRNYNSGTSRVSNFSFGTALTVNAYNQAVEVVSSVNPAYNQFCRITYAANWSMTLEQTGIYNSGLTWYSVRNGMANRSIPSSNTTDISSTSFDRNAFASMTALSLNYEAPPPPTIQASNVTFSGVTSSSMTINWTPGNGTNRIVLVKAGSAVDSNPVSGTSYTASNLFGNGSQIGTGNYVVYNGTGNNVTISNLDGNTTYYVAVYEFSGPPGQEFYLTTNPATGSQLTGTETSVLGDYRSNGSGNWGASDTWQTYNGTAWVTAGSSPTSSDGTITIRNGHTITVTDAVTVDQVVIEATGQVTVNPSIPFTINNGSETVDCIVTGTLYNAGTVTGAGAIAFNSGSTYQHAGNGGTIPSATWDANSMCLITGITNSTLSGFGQTFGNFTWNCVLQTIAVVMNSNVTVQGNFTMTSTNSGRLVLTNGSASRTLTISGNYSHTGGRFDFNNGASSTIVSYMNVAGNFSFTGGTITESSSGRGTISFNGSGQMQTYTSGGTFSNTIDFIVGTGAYLQMGTGSNPSVISLSNGTFTLSAEATLGITDRYGITLAGTGATGGNIRVTGTRNFNTAANYIYNGSITQNTGNGLPSTVNSLVLNNTGGPVTFNVVCSMTEYFSIAAGSKANLGAFTHTTSFLNLGGVGQQSGSYGGIGSGADYELPAYFNAAAGIVNNVPPAGTWLGITSDWNSAANWIGGIPSSSTNAIISSSAANQPVISGTTVASCNILTIKSGASLIISGSAIVTSAENIGNMTINPGGKATITTLTNSGTLDLESDASGMFSLMLDNFPGTTGIVNSKLFFTGGLAGNPADENYRWHYFAVPSRQNKSVLTSIDPDNLMRYDEASAVNDIWEGWQWHDGFDGTTAFNELLVTDGYSFYHDVDTYVTFSGNSLLSSLPVKALGFSNLGWNFIGNSLTCGLNWDNVTFTGDVDHTVHFLKDYQEYYYVQNGPGSPIGTTGHIPPLQGFFVKANASGGSIDFSNAREHNSTSYYKGILGNNEGKKSLPLIRLALRNDRFTDETIIWFNDNSTTSFDKEYDAEKWIPKESRLQIYSYSPDRKYGINGIPLPETSVNIPLALRVPESGSYSIDQIQLEGIEGYGFYLKDIVRNNKIRLNNTATYSFTSSAGTIKDRFILTIEKLSSVGENTSDSDKPFKIYSSSGFVNIELMSEAWEGRQGSVKIIDLTGRTLNNLTEISFSKNSPIQLPTEGRTGLYIIELGSLPLRYTGRVIMR